MKRRDRSITAALTMLMALLVLGCIFLPRPDDLRVTGKTEAAVGERVQFKARVTSLHTKDGGDITQLVRSWKVTETPSTSGPGGATIGPDGVFVATKSGSYTVEAFWERRHARASIVVVGGAAEDADGDVALFQDEPADPATLEQIFFSGNDAEVFNGGKPVSFTLTEPRRIREIHTYHWNNGKGTGGGGTIYLDGPGGKRELPVTRTGEGQGGVPNAYWQADVDFVLEPGTYTISDSDPSTWAQNELTGGKGMAWVLAQKK